MGKSVFHYASSSETHPCDSSIASSIHSMSTVLVTGVNGVYIEQYRCSIPTSGG